MNVGHELDNFSLASHLIVLHYLKPLPLSALGPLI